MLLSSVLVLTILFFTYIKSIIEGSGLNIQSLLFPLET